MAEPPQDEDDRWVAGDPPPAWVVLGVLIGLPVALVVLVAIISR